MTSLRGLLPRDAKQVVCVTCRKIVVIARERKDLVLAVVEHYDKHHQLASGMFLEGPDGHFFIEAAPPHRCDLCSIAAEPPFWTWVTPRTPDYNVEDEEWIICDACHELAEQRNTLALVRRVWSVSRANFAWDDGTKERLRGCVVDFLSHVDPSRSYRGWT